jgi:hypothetical protein
MAVTPEDDGQLCSRSVDYAVRTQSNDGRTRAPSRYGDQVGEPVRYEGTLAPFALLWRYRVHVCIRPYIWRRDATLLFR